MANKYYYRVPYSCSTYGTMTGYVIVDDEEEALEKVENRDAESDEYSDDDSEGYNYYYEDAELELEEEDIESPPNGHSDSENRFEDTEHEQTPAWFLSEINSL
jgi:hypothetical protein